MKAYEVPVKITADGKIEFLTTMIERLPREQAIRAIFLVSEPGDPDEEAEWRRLIAEQFLAGYSDADDIYDKVN